MIILLFRQKENKKYGAPAFAGAPLTGLRRMLIRAVGGGTVGGAVIAGQSPAGIIQNVSGTVSDILQDITGVIDQTAVAVVVGIVVVSGSVVGVPIVRGAIVAGSVISGTVVPVGVTSHSAFVLIAVILTVAVLVAAAAGGQREHQKQGSQQERQTSFHVFSSFAQVFASAIPESYCARKFGGES